MVSFDPYSTEFLQDPYPVYRKLLELRSPTYCEPLGGWVLTSHRDVSAVLRSPVFSVRGRGMPFRSTVSVDPPDHGPLRDSLNQTLNRQNADMLVPSIETIIDRILDQFEGQHQVDLYRRFASPLNIGVAALLLGTDVERLAWMESCSTLGSIQMTRAFPPMEFRLQSKRELEQLVAFFHDIVAEHRQHPRPDMIGGLLKAESAGLIRSELELMGQIALILLSLRETNTNAVANCLAALLEHPAEFQRLRANPQLLDSAINEAMRYWPCGHFISRRTLAEVELSGVTIPKRSLVWCGLAAANRDPEAFPAPDTFDVGRKSLPHLSFATGLHVCQGAYLSRSMMRLALEAILRRFPEIRRVPTPQAWTGNFMGRGANPILSVGNFSPTSTVLRTEY